MLRLTTFLLIIMSFFRVSVSAADLKPFAFLKSPAGWYGTESIAYKDGYIYMAAYYDTDIPATSKGLIAKFDISTGQAEWTSPIEKQDSTIKPRSISILDNGEIEVLSEFAQFKIMSFATGQILNTKRFNTDGKEVFNNDNPDKVLSGHPCSYPIKKNGEHIWVYFTPDQNDFKAYSYAVKHDLDGNYISHSKIDSNNIFHNDGTAAREDTLEMFVIRGVDFDQNNFAYCYGGRNMIEGTNDTTSAFILKLDQNNQKVWRKRFYPEDASFSKINSLNIVEDNNILLNLTIGRTKWIYKISENGNTVWKTEIGDENSRLWIDKLIINSEGNYVGIGSTRMYTAGDYTNDNYIVKLDTLGNLLWEKQEKFQTNQGLNDIIEYEPNKYIIVGNRNETAILYKLDDTESTVKTAVKNDPQVKLCHSADFIMVQKPLEYTNAELIDFSGKIIKSYIIANKSEFTIDKSDLANGAYFIRLSSNEKSTTKKFIK